MNINFKLYADDGAKDLLVRIMVRLRANFRGAREENVCHLCKSRVRMVE